MASLLFLVKDGSPFELSCESEESRSTVTPQTRLRRLPPSVLPPVLLEQRPRRPRSRGPVWFDPEKNGDEWRHRRVSWNGGTPKSFILMVVSLINQPFLGTPIYGNPMAMVDSRFCVIMVFQLFVARFDLRNCDLRGRWVNLS